jgi:hypothetical protein
MLAAVLSPVLVIVVLGVIFVVGVLVFLFGAIPLMRRKSQIERLLEENREALQDAARAEAAGKHGLAEEHEIRARLAITEAKRLQGEQ